MQKLPDEKLPVDFRGAAEGGLEESVLQKSRRQSDWEGCGGVLGDGWRLRMERNVS